MSFWEINIKKIISQGLRKCTVGRMFAFHMTDLPFQSSMWPPRLILRVELRVNPEQSRCDIQPHPHKKEKNLRRNGAVFKYPKAIKNTFLWDAKRKLFRDGEAEVPPKCREPNTTQRRTDPSRKGQATGKFKGHDNLKGVLRVQAFSLTMPRLTFMSAENSPSLKNILCY